MGCNMGWPFGGSGKLKAEFDNACAAPKIDAAMGYGPGYIDPTSQRQVSNEMGKLDYQNPTAAAQIRVECAKPPGR